MAANDYFVIIGAGHAGGVAVQALRGAGHKGPIMLIGDELHLPYERPPLSKELLQFGSGVTFRSMRDEAYYEENNVTLKLGVTVLGIEASSQRISLSDGSYIPYDKLLLTTGGSVRKADVPGADLNGVLYLRTIDDSRTLEKSLSAGSNLIVVGGGFIGLEVAASARARGVKVTVLETDHQLMGRALPIDIAAVFLKLHEENSVTIHLNDGLKAFNGKDHLIRVEAMSGKNIGADLAVVGIGISPETELATSAGLDIENGITVDEFARTSNPNIYAAGDNTNHFNPLLGRHIRLETWQNAQSQAAVAAQNMCGRNTIYAETPWVWSDQYDVNLQMAGQPADWNNLNVRGDLHSRDFIAFQLADGKIEAAIAVNRGRDMRVIRRIMDANVSVNIDDLANEKISMRDILKSVTI